MKEIFENISDEIKKIAENCWKLANIQKNPIKVAELLNIITEYYKPKLTEEELRFLQFYFNMKMEMMR